MRTKKHVVVGLVFLAMQLLVPAAVLAAGDATPGAPATLEQVLERYVEAVGGRTALEQLKTKVCRGRLVDDRPYRGPVKVTPVEAWAKSPDRYLIAQQDPDGIHRDGFDGKAGWRQDARGTEHDDSLGRTKHAWLFNPQGALRLREYFPGMVLRGKETVGERPVYAVDTARDKAHYSLYFDAESGLLIRIGYYWELQDYREVDGIKLPHRVVMSRKGGSTTYVFDEVRHNVPVDDARFAMPSE